MQTSRLNADQLAQTVKTRQAIAEEIKACGGMLPFDRYMDLALYAPGAGYYVNGSRKFGREGDFVTAPEVSAVFSYCLANQCAEVLKQLDNGQVLEFGAGSGIMAADMLAALEQLDQLPQRYLIMELSPVLQQQQRQTLQARVPHLLSRVEWLQQLPQEAWQGVVVANELLDAMPVHRFAWRDGAWWEMFVTQQDEDFVPTWQAVQSVDLLSTLERLQQRVGPLPDDYESEVNLRLPGWMRSVSDFLVQGAVLLVDYGYTETEYYHAERDRGTLIGHFQHRAYDDPFAAVGLQDLTANVDFSAVAEAALDSGLELSGYTTQALFLIACGLDDVMARLQSASNDPLSMMQGVKLLTLPSEMGERFKVIGLSRGIGPLRGFAMRDMRDAL